MYIFVFAGFIKNLKEMEGNHQKKGNLFSAFSSFISNHHTRMKQYLQSITIKDYKKKRSTLKISFILISYYCFMNLLSQEFTRLNECINNNGWIRSKTKER